MMVLHEQITIKEYLDDSWSSWFDGLIDKVCDLGLTQADAPDIQR